VFAEPVLLVHQLRVHAKDKTCVLDRHPLI
jgi:hypothetical protein